MVNQSVISLHNLQYITPEGKELIRDFSFTCHENKIAIVGKNGVGKTTLLKLILGELMPLSGSVAIMGKIECCPQNFQSFALKTVAEVFAVHDKISALKRIAEGSVDQLDFDCVGSDWSIKEDIRKQLAAFGLDNLTLDRKCFSLSGGELTRLFLAKTFFSTADFLLLDEPTNNLDLQSKQFIYQAIERWEKGLIVVSHDRELLTLMGSIMEMTSVGVNIFGGNYNDYVAQKTIQKFATERKLSDAKKQIIQLSKSVQVSREKHEQRITQGNSKRKSGSQPKILLDAMKDKSASNQSRQNKKATQMIMQANKQLQSVKSNIEIDYELRVDLPNTKVPKDKNILMLENIQFSYSDDIKLIDQFDLMLQGPERIALVGENGSGKTTLLKLILGRLKPIKGSVKVGVKKVCYLDQELSLLNPFFSVLENFQNINPKINDTDSRRYLAKFLFRNQEALKIVKHLSGGERIRAALCCVLCSLGPPELIILDEPTNHLDLDSIVALESALNCYQGALIVISHDRAFLENISISKTAEAPFC